MSYRDEPWFASVEPEFREIGQQCLEYGFSERPTTQALNWLGRLFQTEASRTSSVPISALVHVVASRLVEEAIADVCADRWFTPAIVLFFGMRASRERILGFMVDSVPGPDLAALRLGNMPWRLRKAKMWKALRQVCQMHVMNRKFRERSRAPAPGRESSTADIAREPRIGGLH